MNESDRRHGAFSRLLFKERLRNALMLGPCWGLGDRGRYPDGGQDLVLQDAGMQKGLFSRNRYLYIVYMPG